MIIRINAICFEIQIKIKLCSKKSHEDQQRPLENPLKHLNEAFSRK